MKKKMVCTLSKHQWRYLRSKVKMSKLPRPEWAAAVNSRVGGCTSNVGSTNQSLNIPPYFEKYITKSYFGKYDSLLDSDFLDFISHELFPNSCELLLDNLNLVLRVSVQHCSLTSDGSHRHLSSSFIFNIRLELIPELPIHFCEAIIIEKLPCVCFQIFNFQNLKF